jgi:hypothetical protein
VTANGRYINNFTAPENHIRRQQTAVILRTEAAVLCHVLGLVRISRQAWGGVGENISRKAGYTTAKLVDGSKLASSSVEVY